MSEPSTSPTRLHIDWTRCHGRGLCTGLLPRLLGRAIDNGRRRRLAKRKGRSALLHAHAELGDTMLYFAIALRAAAALIAFVHIRQARGKSVKPLARGLIAAVVVVASVATAVQVYRIGDSGAKATWSKQSAAGSPMQ